MSGAGGCPEAHSAALLRVTKATCSVLVTSSPAANADFAAPTLQGSAVQAFPVAQAQGSVLTRVTAGAGVVTHPALYQN